MAAGLALGFLLTLVVFTLLGAFVGPFELILFLLLLAIPLTFAVRPAVRRFLISRQPGRRA